MARATATTLSRNCAATAPMPAHSPPARSHLRFPPSSPDRLVPVATMNPPAQSPAPNDVAKLHVGTAALGCPSERSSPKWLRLCNGAPAPRSEEHTSELQSRHYLV